MESEPRFFPDLNWVKLWSATVSIDCMMARKCNFPRNVRPLMLRVGRIVPLEDRTDRLENITMAGTETNSGNIRRMPLDMPPVSPLASRMRAPVIG